MSSFLYPRTISIRRPTPPSGVGAIAYSGETEANETVILSGLPANIQQKSGRNNRQGDTDLPANSSVQLGWRVFIPKASAPTPGLILNRDIVVDDTGNRYSVYGNYWNSLGYNLLCELEQT
jgi:hypothetical protein